MENATTRLRRRGSYGLVGGGREVDNLVLDGTDLRVNSRLLSRRLDGFSYVWFICSELEWGWVVGYSSNAYQFPCYLL